MAQTKNGLLAVQPGDFNVSRSLLTRGEYDWQPVLWLTRLVGGSSRLIFAGAHIGAVLVPLVRTCPTCQVLAFEPSPQNYNLLTMNLALNALSGVAARNLALGDRPGRISFTENRINTGNSRVSPKDGEITVDLDTLDRCVPAEWDCIDLIVMDIEGSEVAAMRGADRVLKKTRYLYVEFAPEQLLEQNSSASEFVELVSTYFKSAYVFGNPVVFTGDFAAYLKDIQNREGLLLNVLFTQDLVADPSRMNLVT